MNAVDKILDALEDSDNEGTRAPYWLILDPIQNMRLDIHQLAAQISGPFFSRKDAQDHLDSTRYNYSEHARVYCCSGAYSKKYSNLCEYLDL